ncbi:hypothetical protein [Sulfurimonas sp.]|uniref:hypothetical protein n=1 Tax=Sulfurimonas sp. TaxID=2022749 RepID=UPI0035671F0D
MEKITSEMGIVELGSYICTELEKEGVDVALSGEACMEIYSKKFASYDIDLIERYSTQHKTIMKVMEKLGFEQDRGKYFKHKNNQYMVEFPTGPVTVGDEFVKEFATIETEFGLLRLLSVTDCIKDRLSAFVYHFDEECLYQAVDVALNNKIDYENLDKWVTNEAGNSMQKGYDRFTKEIELQSK